MKHRFRVFLALALLHSLAGHAFAFTSNLGVQSSFLEPAGWNVGDAGSTHQVWDVLSDSTSNEPDRTYNTAGQTLTKPTLGAKPPGYSSGTLNFYSFTGDHGATAQIYNHGGPTAGMGTHVIVQVGGSMYPGEDSIPNNSIGVYLNSMKLLDLSNAVLSGGTNLEKLQVSELSYYEETLTSFGYVEYQELIFEFWLPGYTGNFRVDWDQSIHALIDTVRVDTMIASQAIGGGTPFPLTSVGGPYNGDYNSDLVVDAGDYVTWRKNSGSFGGPQGYTDWKSHFGETLGNGSGVISSVTVPEPTTALLLTLGAGCLLGIRRRRTPEARNRESRSLPLGSGHILE